MEYRITVVDDEAGLTENLKYELEYLNPELKVTGFSTGFAALMDVMRGNTDLVLTDIAMPDMDGYELYSRIKEYDETLPVILMTGFGYDPNHVVVKAKQVGPVDVVPKPFNLEKLVTLILTRVRPRAETEAAKKSSSF